jgi:hypothetical protein
VTFHVKLCLYVMHLLIIISISKLYSLGIYIMNYVYFYIHNILFEIVSNLLSSLTKSAHSFSKVGNFS